MASHGHLKLGLNRAGYGGETLDISAVLAEAVAVALARGWSVERIPAAPKPDLLTFRRLRCGSAAAGSPGAGECRRVYLSAGIHGDEPAGPLAILQLLESDTLPQEADVWICPCLNPAGFVLNQRENGDGLDLNRQYLEPTAEETIAHIRWLKAVPNFDLCLCLHEDWEANGFYVYELNPDVRPSLAPDIVRAAGAVCPVDYAELIEGRPAHGGIIRPDAGVLARPQWPEAFYLLTHKTRLSYTLEAPSDYPLPTRVAALREGVKAALAAAAQRPL